MIVNEIAKFEKPAPRALQRLRVAELREPAFVVGLLCSRPSRSLLDLPLKVRSSVLRPGAYSRRQGSRPASTCSVPRRWSAMIRMASAGSRFCRQSTQPRVLRVGPRQHLGRVGDVGDQVGHRALGLGHRRHQRGGAGRLGQADVEAHVGAPVGGEVVELRGHRVDQVARAARSRRRRALGGQQRDAELDREAARRSGRASRRAPPGWRSERRLGHERPAAAAAHGVQVPALDQRGQRLAQRRARDAELLAQVALRRAAACRAAAGRA